MKEKGTEKELLVRYPRKQYRKAPARQQKPNIIVTERKETHTMTFQEIFKSSFLENVASVSLLDMTLALVGLLYTCPSPRDS